MGKISGREQRLSCMSALNIIYYFNKQKNIPVTALVEGLSVDYKFIENTSNWVNNSDAYKLFSNAAKNVKGFSHTDWKETGSMIYKGKTPGYFKVLFNLLPLEMIYPNVPKYAGQISKLSSYEIISARPGR